MGKEYIYLHHEGFDIYLSDRMLTPEETYCGMCDAHDTLIAECNTIEELNTKLAELTKKYDIMECYNCGKIKREDSCGYKSC